jgi:hypothetical protein
VNDEPNTDLFPENSASEADDLSPSVLDSDQPAEFDQAAANAFEEALEALRRDAPDQQSAESIDSANPFADAPVQPEVVLPYDFAAAEPHVPDFSEIGELTRPPGDSQRLSPVELPEDVGALQSPIRPVVPDQPPVAQPSEPDAPIDLEDDDEPDDPQEALENIRRKMEDAASEFSNGKLNRAQFSAIYKHYGEKRTIIEKLIARDPASEAWKHVAEEGHTTFLRSHFEARPVFYAVFLNDQYKPVMTGGKQLPRAVDQINKLLKAVWTAQNRPASGDLARKDIGDTLWLALAVGMYGVTFVVFALQPSVLQMNRLRDLHTDFERANRISLERGTATPERMVFPQRSLIP